MKNIIVLLCLVIAVTSGCVKGDLDDIRKRLDNLEAWQQSMTNDISSLKTLITAIEERDCVISVTPLADGTGYVLKMAKSGAVTIKHGNAGQTVVVSAKLDSDNKYYWTVGGEWLMNGGAKIAVSGKAPQVKANTTTKKWEVSVDGGATWIATNIDVQSGSIFAPNGVDDSNEKYVSLTLADGTVIHLARYVPLHFMGEDEPGVLYMGVEQGNSRTLEVAVPADITADDYVGMTVSITGDWGTTTQIVSRSLEAVAWVNIELDSIKFDSVTGKKTNNPIIHFYIDQNKVNVGQIAIVKTTFFTNISSFETSTSIKVVPTTTLDVYKVNGEPYGIILRIKTHDKLGLIMSLDEKKSRWSFWSGNVANAISLTDGAANTAAVFGSDYYNAEVQTIFAWCAAKNETAPTGIKWYIPAKEELTDIYKKKNALNATLNAIRATPFSSRLYWSSTQLSASNAWAVSFDDGVTSGRYKDSVNIARIVSAY